MSNRIPHGVNMQEYMETPAKPAGKPDDEEWRPVVGWEGFYEVSSLGRVKSVTRVIPHPICKLKTVRERIMALRKDKDGYACVGLKRDGIQKGYFAHVLVLEAFIGPRPDGCLGCHGPLGNQFNTPENLSWGTPSSNMMDRHRDGTLADMRGERAGMAKLTDAAIVRIRAMRGIKKLTELADEYGVSFSLISQVQRGVIWRHVN